MCLGIPMRIVASDEFSAQCEYGDALRTISLVLVGPQAPGTWLLTHLDSAVRVITHEEARLIQSALAGLARAREGHDIDAYFADLVGREPTLPEHLRGR